MCVIIYLVPSCGILNPAGRFSLTIHGALYDRKCVIHSRSKCGVFWKVLDKLCLL